MRRPIALVGAFHFSQISAFGSAASCAGRSGGWKFDGSAHQTGTAISVLLAGCLLSVTWRKNGEQPRNLEDIDNLSMEAVASTITKLDKIGVKLHIIQVTESKFCVIFNQFLQNKDLGCETMPSDLFCF